MESEEKDIFSIHIKSSLTKKILSKIISSAVRKKIPGITIKVDECDFTSKNLDEGGIHGRVSLVFDTNIRDIMEAMSKE